MPARLARLRARQRESASLAIPSRRVVRRLISATQGTTRLGPFVTPQTFELAAGDGGLASAEREHADGPRFFAHFPDGDDVHLLRGARVLDLGCGYGGRTVWYAEHGAPREITGIEISEPMVERCRAFAARRAAEQVRFDVGFAERLEFPDAAFDAVLSYDVLEHVEDPAQALREIARVLTPGGTAWLVFPTYLGARSSHLDYLTQVPFLHRVFDPDTLIDVVNEFLRADPERYGVKAQPAPRLTVVGRRALPTLNGMSRRDALSFLAAAGLEIEWQRTEPLFRPTARVPLAGPLSRGMARLADRDRLPEVLISHLAFRVRRFAR
jgi:SAM-dependent methyltransferase